MAKYKDYPVYTYDEPVTYNDFSGGINSDPASENLAANEMRDCLNMTYSSASLIKRKGAKLLCTIECQDELFNIQGIFMFTYRITYIIIAADGKLYSGAYNENAKIVLDRLHIRAELPTSSDIYNPLNIFEGLNVYYEEQINNKHDGFIVSYAQEESRFYEYKGETFVGYARANKYYARTQDGETLYADPVTGERRTADEMYHLYPEILPDTYALFQIPSDARYVSSTVSVSPYKFVGKFEDVDDTLLRIGDVVEYENQKYILYSTRNPNGTFHSSKINFDNDEFWVTIDEYKRLFAQPIADGKDPIATAWKTGMVPGVRIVDGDVVYDLNALPVHETEKKRWKSGWAAKTYNGSNYVIKVCIKDHDVYLVDPTDTAQFSPITEVEELIFQNYRKIQAATLDNKLYIATGTLFTCVEVINNNLVAFPVLPYECNNTEITKLGYNYLSPYPEFCRKTIENTATTSIGNVLVAKLWTGKFELRPMMTFAAGESRTDYFYKWEKKLSNGTEEDWYTIVSFKQAMEAAKLGESYYSIIVDDADKYLYRVTFGKAFERETSIVDEWEWDENASFKEGDMRMVGTTLYQCVTEHDCDATAYTELHEFRTDIPAVSKQQYKICKKTSVKRKNEAGEEYTEEYVQDVIKDGVTVIVTDQEDIDHYVSQSKGAITYFASILVGSFKTIQEHVTLWKKIYEEEEIDVYNEIENKFEKGTDLTIDKIDGEYFGSATSVLFEEPTGLNDTYKIIQSCTKIVKDGNKLLLYGDNYNSGSWYKTVISNPAYIGNIGSLSFKTTKNEELVSVILFNGNIIAFANSENAGGSIHLVTGSGDDYSSDEYYSPYRKTVINTNISCDNADTIQVCENILVFKYFDTLYYISSSELTNETVSIYSCNDKLKSKSLDVEIPWDDNDCFSEVTDDYYALCWKEKYIVENDDLILERPAMRIKMYYKMPYQDGNKYHYPWLRDESEYFNSTAVLYIKGKPVYLYNNTLISFNENIYTDLDKPYECRVHFKGVDIGYPKMFKLIQNVLVYYHRNQYSKIDFDLTVKNEAGHVLIDSSQKRASLQDLRALRAGDKFEEGAVRLDSTVVDTKVFNAAYRFPCLLADTIISANNDKEFSVASVTYNYITVEPPETTPYDLYSSIIRPKEI